MNNEELREKIKATNSADEAWHIIENELAQRGDILERGMTAERETALEELKSKHEKELSEMASLWETKMSEKDTLHAAALAEKESSHEKAMQSERAEWEQKLSGAITAREESLNHVYSVGAERDKVSAENAALQAALAQRAASQDDLASRAKVQFLAVQGAFEILSGILKEALTPQHEREASARLDRIAQLQAEISSLNGA